MLRRSRPPGRRSRPPALRHLPSMISHSPVWRPALISRPSERTASTIATAHPTARAGPSNVAKKPSPAVSVSTPRWRASSSLTTEWCRRTRSFQARSPSDACSSVDPTISVNRTVASTVCGTPDGRTPVTNASISSASASVSPTHGARSPTGQPDERRVRDRVGDPSRHLRMIPRQVIPRQDEGGDADRRQDSADIRLTPLLQEGDGYAGARGECEVSREQRHLGIVRGHGGRRVLVVLARGLTSPSAGPQCRAVRDGRLPLLEARAEREILGPPAAGVEGVGAERERTRGEARREQGAELRAILVTDQVHPLDPHRIEHREEVLHLGLERRQVAG